MGETVAGKGHSQGNGAELRIEILPLAQVVPDPVVVNHRRIFPPAELQAFGDCIRAQGQQTPVVVRPAGDGSGGWWLVAGERRFRALHLVGADSIIAQVREMTDAEAAELQAAENLARVNPRPCEAAAALAQNIEKRREEDPDATEEDLRRAAGIASSIRLQEVNRALLLLELPETVRDLVDEGALSPGHGWKLSELMPEHEAHCIRLARSAVGDAWRVEVTTNAVNKYLGKQSQGALFGAEVGEQSQAAKRTRDALRKALGHYKGAASNLFDGAAQEMADLALGELTGAELAAVEAQLRGAAAVLQAATAEVLQAQGKEVGPVAVATVATPEPAREVPDGIRCEMRGSWLWVSGAPDPEANTSLGWALHRAGGVWNVARGAWYAPTADRIEAVRAVLREYAEMDDGAELAAAG